MRRVSRAETIECLRWYEGYIPFKTRPISVKIRDKIRKGEVKRKKPINYNATFHHP